MGIPLSSFGMILSLILDLTGEPAKGLCFLLRWVPWKSMRQHNNPRQVYQYYTVHNIFTLVFNFRLTITKFQITAQLDL
jgi:hypothetical protein